MALVRAPIDPRLKAGLVDGVAVAALSLASFVLPMLTVGVTLPMWGVLAVMVGYSVVPLAFTGKTLGLRLFGLELVRADGHLVDLGNVVFRELLGRGLFPAAYLLTLVGGAIGQLLGVFAFGVPSGLGALLMLACLGLLSVALLGSLLAVTSEDGRSLADVLARSYVVVGPARALPEDADERAEALAHRRQVVRRVAVFEVALAVAVLGVPWLLTARVGESSQHRTERIKRQGLQKKFDAAPADEALAQDLAQALARDGQRDEAKAVLERHQRARRAQEDERERHLRAELAKANEERTAALLIELLEGQDRLDDAIAVYRSWLGPTPRPSRRAGFGHWLGVRGRNREAIAELRRALEEDPLVPMGHTMLGIVLAREGSLEEARFELAVALGLDPDDEDASDAAAELGPLPDADRRKVADVLVRLTADAGR